MFESGNRVQDTLADLADIMGARDAAICREMTKMHEEISRAPVAELARSAATLETRGEFVLVIGPPAAGAQAMTEQALDDLLRDRLKRDSVKDAVAHAVELSGRPRREIYARALELARQGERGGDGQSEKASANSDGAATPDKPTKAASPARVAAFRTGVSAEGRAAAFLMAKGYRILMKRFRTPYGEIDIVARRRNLLVFVEVKARASLDEAAYAVTPRQQARIIAAAQAWLMAHPSMPNLISVSTPC